MTSAFLQELIEKPITGEWGSEGEVINVLRTTNFNNDGTLSFDNVVKRDIAQKKVEAKTLKRGDIIIEKSGGSPTQPVGRVVYFDKEGVYLCNNFTSVLRPKQELVFPKYLLYILFSNHKFGVTNGFQNKTTGIINLQLPRYISNLQIPLPPLPTQKKIAAILDAADALRNKTQQIISEYDQLAQSIFLEMFGDPSLFENKSIAEIASEEKYSLSSGPFGSNLTSKHYTNSGVIILRGTNISSGRLDLSNVKYVSEEKAIELKRSLIKPGDIVIIAVGSSGKALQVPLVLEKAVMSQNFNKITPNLQKALPTYLEYCFNSQLVQNQFAKEMTDTVRTFLSLTKIKEVKIPLPPITLQTQFSEKIALIEQQKELAKQSLAESEDLFSALLQKAFKGELVS
ncbi:restriction endonuclease subunit S [Carboxylicivirga sp. N1Y90]|uniref:restriction endonuclease subunit S n=1 Tax=Carboxylicivirga fragile TaxID=3417571 RepID=UPI003D33F449|nr:restriction endonuclease subunit S [Marinilabiliaceae bacterium N1Y90]